MLELCNAYLDLVFPEGIPDEFEDTMRALAERLEEIAENRVESLETI